MYGKIKKRKILLKKQLKAERVKRSLKGEK